MSVDPKNGPSSVLPHENTKTWHCGTLAYTKPALTILFFWLIWGDICYTLMENVGGPIMQFKFHDKLGATDEEMAIFLNTIPSLVYTFFNPVISFKSDRFRSRWGRRIPFLLASVPMLAVGLVGLAFGDQLGAYFYHCDYLHVHSPEQGTTLLRAAGVALLALGLLDPGMSYFSERFRRGWGRNSSLVIASIVLLAMGLVALVFGEYLGGVAFRFLEQRAVTEMRVRMWTYGGLLLVFTFFNTFTTTTFWYLFNDVVPEHLLARFMSWFRVVSVLALAGYNFFIFGYSSSHSTEIFLGAAVLCLVGFGMMCWNVREGRYPPPPPYVGKGTGPIAIVKTYGKECHSNRIYWYLWLCTFIGCMGSGVGMYDLVFKKNAIGLTEAQIGYMNGTNMVLMAVLVIGAGWLADRIEAIRVVLISQILGWLIVFPASLVWIFWRPDPSETWTFHLPLVQYLPYLSQFAVIHPTKVVVISFVIYVGLTVPIASLGSMWDPVMLMRTFPRSRLGQFCSMNAIWRTMGALLGTLLAGLFFGWVRRHFGIGDQAYVYSPLWAAIFTIPGFFFFVLFYREWKRLGGAKGYVPPVPGEEPSATPATPEPVAVGTVRSH